MSSAISACRHRRCWRGNAAGFGGRTFGARNAIAALQATGLGFFGLNGSTSARATTLTFVAVESENDRPGAGAGA